MKKLFFSLLAASALLAPLAQAQTGITWNGAGNTTFSNNGNWVGGTAPASSLTTNYAIFSGSPTGNQPNVNATRNIAGLDFQSAGWTLSGSSALTIGAFGIDSAGAGNNTISAPITVNAANGTWTIGSGNRLDMSGLLTMTSGFAVDGNGTLRLSGTSANTGTGAVTIGAGTTVEIDKVNVAAFGAAQPVIVNGTVKWLQAGVAGSTVQFTVNTGGLLDLNNNNASFGFSATGGQKITLSGGTVQTGNGTWTMVGNNSTPALVNGSTVSTITGNVEMNGFIRKKCAYRGETG